MRITSSYGVDVLNRKTIKKPVRDTLKVYRDALAYIIRIVNAHWDDISAIKGSKLRQRFVESLIHATDSNTPVCDFDERFPRMPSYLRRSAISAAIGHVSSYRSNLKAWEEDKKGAPPTLSPNTLAFPVFYRENMYKEDEDGGGAYIKLYVNKAWTWVRVFFRRQDVRYLQKHWSHVEASAPTLYIRRGKVKLVFSFTETVELSSRDVYAQKALAVDLGINNDAVMSVMDHEGTVYKRKFISLSYEKALLYHMLGILAKTQRISGSKYTHKIWEYIHHLNDIIAERTAAAIVSFAEEQNVDVIVFEYLDMRSSKPRGKKQKLSLWRKNDIQARVSHKAHRKGIHISRVCAYGTSRLAYDGSGAVKRDANNYSMCTFASGKRYNCDLSASYNIGARYFVRAILKTLSKSERSRVCAKVHGCAVRTQCVWSSLISLNAELRDLSRCF